MKPRLVPQPYENRRELAKSVDLWHRRVEEYPGNTSDMEYRIRKMMCDWLTRRLNKATLYHRDRKQYREIYGKWQHNREEHRTIREFNRNAKTLG